MRLRRAVLSWMLPALACAGATGPALGQAVPAAAAPAASAGGQERGLNEWLLRLQDASRQRSYTGTFVVSSATGALHSARIWHAGEGGQQVERVEVLTGAPRSTFRRNDEVLTFLPEQRLVRAERRESMGQFPNLVKAGDNAIADFYAVRRLGADRVAGFDADVVQLSPRDALRFGWRIWSEKRSGLVVKLQTLDADGGVLEQAAFSELQLDSPVRGDKLAQMMQPPAGWRVERLEPVRTSPGAEGWALRQPVAGFRPLHCYKRYGDGSMHWIFSDGLASVSLFVEPYDRQRHAQEGAMSAGATQTLTRRIDDWWVTAVGEVPPATLKAFALNLERRR